MPIWVTSALGFLKAFFGFAEKVTEEVHDHNQRVAGENEVVAADLKEANDADQKALQAATDTNSSSVRDSLRRGDF